MSCLRLGVVLGAVVLAGWVGCSSSDDARAASDAGAAWSPAGRLPFDPYTYAKNCTADTDCVVHPALGADCSSCDCGPSFRADVSQADYDRAQAACAEPGAPERKRCGLYCPSDPYCKDGQCAIRPGAGTSGFTPIGDAGGDEAGGDSD